MALLTEQGRQEKCSMTHAKLRIVCQTRAFNIILSFDFKFEQKQNNYNGA